MRRLPRSTVAWVLLLPALGVLLPFFALPVLVLARNSLNRDDPRALMVPAWSLENYGRVLTDPLYYGAFANTLEMAALIAAITLVVGYPFAYYTARFAGRWRGVLRWVMYLPLSVSVIVRVFGWMAITADSGLVNAFLLGLGVVREPIPLLFGLGGLVLGLTHRYLPLIVFPVTAALTKVDPAVLRASASLGARPVATFWRVTLPLSVPGIVAGVQLVLAAVLSDFVMPLLLGTTRFRMLAPAIYDEAMGNVSWASAAAMAITMLAIVGALLAASASAVRRLVPWARSL